MAFVVVNLGVLQCTCGDAPVPITILPANKVMCGGMPAGNIMDHKPAVNIMPFGTCKTLTAAASGVPTPCVPATVSPWAPGSTSTITIGGMPALLDSDTLVCTVGGAISVKSAGQTTVQMS